MTELATHEEIAERFQDLRNQATQVASRLHDLSAEKAEHEAVIKALESLDPERKCYRLVGEVLVERTVKEVLPAVRGNEEQIEMVSKKLEQQLSDKKKELSDFQEKYKIRIRSSAEAAAEEQQAAAAAAGASKAQGVLI